LIFFSRFIVQWIATERNKKVVVPIVFWYLSIAGTLILLAYAIQKRDSVFIFAYAFAWIPYFRNLKYAREEEREKKKQKLEAAANPLNQSSQ
jgi:lipid-A-disaccharide synthase-like uncharacterized protein